MKTLMTIAICAVAFATSTFADTTTKVYDFTATLKTTKANMGKAIVKVNLGVNATGTKFWYEDDAVANFLDSTKTIRRSTVPTISDATIATNLEARAAVAAIASTYSYKSAGKWCAIFKWSDEDCYRISGTKKINDVFFLDDCCSTELAFTNSNGSSITYQENATEIGTPLLQSFGSIIRENANKVEIYAPVVLKDENGAEVFNGWLAGQGTIAWKNSEAYINTVSGNIVGTLPAPMCESCCSTSALSYAFDCLNPLGAELPYTAGFGTFTLKFNKKLSTF